MTPLRQRMIDDMQLRGLSARTQEAYVTAVRQLAQHYRRSPDRITEEELRQYFLYLANEKKVARATATITLCAVRFLYEQSLHRPWTTLRFVRPQREKKLPVVLSRDEVRTILAEVRIPVYRACLTTIYGCGLRLLEGTRLEVPDVDSARMVLFIHGKGKQDRYVPLSHSILEVLRYHWRTHRSPRWLFPAVTRHGTTWSVAHDAGPITWTCPGFVDTYPLGGERSSRCPRATPTVPAGVPPPAGRAGARRADTRRSWRDKFEPSAQAHPELGGAGRARRGPAQRRPDDRRAGGAAAAAPREARCCAKSGRS